jgi:isopentenyl-diphosphate delta-isomerase
VTLETEKQVTSEQFSQRKKDHIEISLRGESQAPVDQFSCLQLQHNPVPEINFSDVSLECRVFGHRVQSPLFVSSMTLGHEGAGALNHVILSACATKGWMMGVGSQRRQLFDPEGHRECEQLRAQFPNNVIFGNIGLAQAIECTPVQIQNLVDSLGAQFLVVHCNPLQEAMQPEGTPHFHGGLQALQNLTNHLSVPLVLKETGCGFSEQSFEKLKNLGLAAVDVSGLGGTHWGRVEGLRMSPDSVGFQVAQTFANWGISTVDSLQNGIKTEVDFPLWASGGVRNGLQAAKLLALGAEKVGFAQPILQAAVQGPEALVTRMDQLDRELKVAMFCLGIDQVPSLVGKRTLLKWT